MGGKQRKKWRQREGVRRLCRKSRSQWPNSLEVSGLVRARVCMYVRVRVRVYVCVCVCVCMHVDYVCVWR
jgi:hypothetical protein